MAVVWIPALLRDLTGGQDRVEVPGNTVRQIVEGLNGRFPGIKDRLCSGFGLRPGLAVVVDAQTAPLGLLQPVGDTSEVHFIVAVAGG